MFLNFIYELLRRLISPALPQTFKNNELVDLLKTYYEPKPLFIAERFHLHRRNHGEGESIAGYIMAELRSLSTHCEFKTYLNDALRDRLVCEIRSESMQDDYWPKKNCCSKRQWRLCLGWRRRREMRSH